MKRRYSWRSNRASSEVSAFLGVSFIHSLYPTQGLLRISVRDLMFGREMVDPAVNGPMLQHQHAFTAMDTILVRLGLRFRLSGFPVKMLGYPVSPQNGSPRHHSHDENLSGQFIPVHQSSSPRRSIGNPILSSWSGKFTVNPISLVFLSFSDFLKLVLRRANVSWRSSPRQ